jgi:AcrR family transcriptional regulator
VANRDPEATKARILAAAVREFSAKGISGARVDAIAARARTNKRMIYYYFGSKDGLFREILRQQLAARHAQHPTLDELSWSERLVARQALTLTIPDYVRLLMWEALETGSRKKPVINEEERAAVFDDLRERIVAAQEAGELPREIDPGQMVLSELAMTMFPVAFPQITRMATGHAVDDPQFLAERQRFLRVLSEQLTGRSVGT